MHVHVGSTICQTIIRALIAILQLVCIPCIPPFSPLHALICSFVIFSSLLSQMQRYCTSTTCRRRLLLEHFGETLSGDCGQCDNCKTPEADKPTREHTILACHIDLCSCTHLHTSCSAVASSTLLIPLLAHIPYPASLCIPLSS